MARLIIVVTTTGVGGKGSPHEYILWNLAKGSETGELPADLSDNVVWKGWALQLATIHRESFQFCLKSDSGNHSVALINKLADRLKEPQTSYDGAESANSPDTQRLMRYIEQQAKRQAKDLETAVLVHAGSQRIALSIVDPSFYKATYDLTHLKSPTRPAHPNLYHYVKSLFVRKSTRPDDAVWQEFPDDWSARADLLWENLPNSSFLQDI